MAAQFIIYYLGRLAIYIHTNSLRLVEVSSVIELFAIYLRSKLASFQVVSVTKMV